MKKQLLITLKLIGLSGTALAVSGLTPDDSKQLPPEPKINWSINGGVINNSALTKQAEDVKQLIIQNPDGRFGIKQVNTDVHHLETEVPTVIKVDRTAPVVKYDWFKTIEQAGVITVGPDSKVTIYADTGVIESLSINDENIQVNAPSYTRKFMQPNETFTVSVVDEFGNKGESSLLLKSDFDSPELNWQLEPPAVYKSQTWFAGESAKAMLSVSDENQPVTLFLNQQALNLHTESIAVSSGDVITLTDGLGNQASEIISWEIDDAPPVLKMQSANQQQTAFEVLTVGVNEVFELVTVDTGMGVESQKYQGKYRKWQMLPKKFKFSSTGRFRIKVKSFDSVGNTLESTIKIKVRR